MLTAFIFKLPLSTLKKAGCYRLIHPALPGVTSLSNGELKTGEMVCQKRRVTHECGYFLAGAVCHTDAHHSCACSGDGRCSTTGFAKRDTNAETRRSTDGPPCSKFIVPAGFRDLATDKQTCRMNSIHPMQRGSCKDSGFSSLHQLVVFDQSVSGAISFARTAKVVPIIPAPAITTFIV